ncbi:3-deoxy-D-manno-octulosonic acid transferase [candidate division KSB1 bacterium]
MAKFNSKIKKVQKERKELFTNLQNFRKDFGIDEKVVLFHCVSMGELLNAKPLAKKIKERFPEIKIAVSFISPSGYDNLKKSPEFDFKTYLPIDRYGNAEKFFSILKPLLWIIVKHDIWPAHIKACSDKNIPIILIDANLPEKSKRLQLFIRSFFKSFYKDIDLVMPVSENDAERFLKVYPFKDKVIPVGDTRYDEVFANSRIAIDKQIKYLSFYKDKKVFTGGSVWKEDMKRVIPALPKLMSEFDDFYVILVPHEPNKVQISYLEGELINLKLAYNKYTELNDFPSERILIIDSVGILASSYKYSYIAYVGGSFTTGVHNVMEPAIFESPVLFGPKHGNSFEALEMIKRGGAFSVSNSDDVYSLVSDFLKDTQKKEKSGKAAASVVLENLGATDRIMNYVETYFH